MPRSAKLPTRSGAVTSLRTAPNNVTVPLNDLGRCNNSILDEIHAAIERVLSSGWYVLGPEVEAFESEFAAYCGVPHCIGVANGTDALELAIRTLGVGPAEQVVTTANAGMYSSSAIRAVGADPVYVDVDPQTMNMDPTALANVLSPEIKAIIVTHLYGRMAAMPQLMRVASRAGVPIVEDCAQAHGAHIDGRKAGSFGELGCFSFYPTKNLGALGDGGAIITKDSQFAERLRMLRQYGWSTKYCSRLQGGRNSRLDELQAAILRVKLPRLDTWNESRRRIAEHYWNGLQHLDLDLPANTGDDYVAHLYVVRTTSRSDLSRQLAAAGITTDIHYPVPDHLQESARLDSLPNWELPITEEYSQQIVTLPCFYGMTAAEISRVVIAVNNAAS